MKRLLPLLVLPALAGCATTTVGGEPSLAPRAAETIDPRLPVGSDRPVGAPAAALVDQLSRAKSEARAAAALFDAAQPATAALVAGAGEPRSESWITAQQSVSALEALRAPIAAALTRIDSLAAERIAATGGVAPADLEAIDAARREVGDLNEQRAAVIDGFTTRLGS